VIHDPTARVLFDGSTVLWAVIELALRVRAARRGRSAPEWTLLFVFVVLGASVVATGAVARQHVAPLPGSDLWPVVVGLTLLWAGVTFRVWAIHTLGRYFKFAVVIQDRHRVVDSGPYRHVRHPSYTGAIAALVGIGIAQGDGVGVAIMAAGALVAFVVRIHVEERVLLRELGEPYGAYMRRTARLVPGVY